MYACFRSIPQEVRQWAFDVIVAREPDASARVFLGGLQHCPWGVINAVLEQKDADFITNRVLDCRDETSYILTHRLPGCETEAFHIRQLLGVQVSPVELRVFMDDADAGKFDTNEKLALAMGVNYTQPQE